MNMYRIEYEIEETEATLACYLSANNVEEAVKDFRDSFPFGVEIVEVSRVINRDWSKL